MSLKVPSANSLQLFKDGYKVSVSVRSEQEIRLTSISSSIYKGSKTQSFGISRPYANSLISFAQVSVQMVGP
jgi:hypothetical protein